MTVRIDDTRLFAEVRALKQEWGGLPGLTAGEVARIKAALEAGDPSDLVTFGPAPEQPAAPVSVPKSARLTVTGLQERIGAKPDGAFGPASRKLLAAALTNTAAPALTAAEIGAAASRLGVGANIVRAIRKVEAPRGSFDVTGKPTHLYERHVFARNTVPKGRYNVSHPDISGGPYGSGGYGAYSAQFDKLADACFLDPEAAFAACSWGAFQVLGENARALGYPSPFDFALALTAGEAAHLESFIRFVEVNGLVDELRQVRAGVPDSAIPFVSRYNGPGFRQFNYHVKLTDAAL